MKATTKQTTTNIVHTNVEYKIVEKIGFYDIVVKYVNGIESKRFKVKNYL
jgi:hypothetical protein